MSGSRRRGYTRFLPVVSALITIALGLLIPPASATSMGGQAGPVYVDSGSDPDDVPDDQGESGQLDPDIRSTNRKVRTDEGGGRSLFVKVRTYEDLLGFWSIVVRLDTRGGPRTDARMRLFDTGVGPLGCKVRLLPGGSTRAGHLHLLPGGADWTACRAPLRWVHPNKHIRWKLFSAALHPPYVDEFAPSNRGWYA